MEVGYPDRWPIGTGAEFPINGIFGNLLSPGSLRLEKLLITRLCGKLAS